MPDLVTGPAPNGLSAAGAIVRRADPDRFLTALFAPPARREALFTLYAFNYETARARAVAHEPMMALIRLQWWREVVQGARKQHEVATPLSALLESGGLPAGELLSVLDAREVDELPTIDAWRAWLLSGPGSLAVAAGRLLGDVGEAPRLRELGAGYGAAGVLRSIVSMARAGHCLLPGDVLAAHGLSADAVIANPADPALVPVVAALAGVGRDLLGRRARFDSAIAAALPAVLARHDLRQTANRVMSAEPRGVVARLRVTAAAVTRQV